MEVIMENEIIGLLKEEDLTALKAKYPGSSSATFEISDGKTAIIYLKKIDRPVFTAANRVYGQDELKAGEILINSLWIGGYDKEAIKTDLDALKNCSATIMPLLFVKIGELKKN